MQQSTFASDSFLHVRNIRETNGMYEKFIQIPIYMYSSIDQLLFDAHMIECYLHWL